MALIGNYSVLNKTPGKTRTGSSVAGAAHAFCRSNWNRTADWRKFSCQDASAGTVDSSSTQYAARPQGAYQPKVYALPNKAGAITAHNRSFATMSASATGTRGVNAEGTTTLSVSVSGTGSLIVSGTGSFTVNLTTTASILAALLGTGSFTLSLDGSSTTLNAHGNMVAASNLTITMNLTSYATGELAGDWTADYGTFTPELLASAVWNALISDYGVADTMGAALDELHKIHGLSSGTNLVVTPTSRVAGSISQTIGTSGSTTTVTRP